MKKVVAALLLSLGLVMATASFAPANAHTATPYIKKLAKKMRCKYGTSEALATDARVKKSWHCVVGAGTKNRREYYLTTYVSTSRALDEWRDWLSCSSDFEDSCEPGYMARKGKVLIIDQSPRDSYTKQAASYAARKTGGRAVAGYRY